MLVSGRSDILKELKDPEKTRGLIRGALLSNTLAYPDPETGQLCYTQALAGQWIAYDFNRRRVFPDAYKDDSAVAPVQGKLWAFMIDEVAENPPEAETPTHLFNLRNFDHLTSMVTPSIQDLLDSGFVQASTYREAYEEAGLYDRYAQDLASRNLTGQQVFTITPKGSTLVFLMPDSGHTSPPQPHLEPGLDPVVTNGFGLA